MSPMNEEDHREPVRLPEADLDHTVKNHLAVIVGYCELLLTDTPTDDPRRADIQEIQQSARELIAIFNTHSVR